MPFSTFRKIHVEDLKAGDRFWFSDSLNVVVSVVPDQDATFAGCHRIYTQDPAPSGRDYIYTMPDHEFIAPHPGQSDEAFILEVARALEVMAARHTTVQESVDEAADVLDKMNNSM